jgi:hypothetical protein
MTTATDIKKASRLAKTNKADFYVYTNPTFDGQTIFKATDRQPVWGLDLPYGDESPVYAVSYFGTGEDNEPCPNWIESVDATEILKGIWVYQDS